MTNFFEKLLAIYFSGPRFIVLNGCFYFFLSFVNSSFILDFNPVRYIADKDCLPLFHFTWLIVSLAVQKLFTFINSRLSAVNLKSWSNGVVFRKSFQNLYYVTYCIYFLLVVLCSVFLPLIYLELVLLKVIDTGLISFSI